MDEATAKLMAERDIWLSSQPFLAEDEESTPFPPGSQERAKKMMVVAGTDTVYAMAKKYKLKTAWGTDVLFDAAQAAHQGAMLTRMVRWFTVAEAVRAAKRVNCAMRTL